METKHAGAHINRTCPYVFTFPACRHYWRDRGSRFAEWGEVTGTVFTIVGDFYSVGRVDDRVYYLRAVFPDIRISDWVACYLLNHALL